MAKQVRPLVTPTVAAISKDRARKGYSTLYAFVVTHDPGGHTRVQRERRGGATASNPDSEEIIYRLRKGKRGKSVLIIETPNGSYRIT